MENCPINCVLNEEEYGWVVYRLGTRIDEIRRDLRQLGFRPSFSAVEWKKIEGGSVQRLMDELLCLRSAYIKIHGEPYSEEENPL
jgi:hypothetical protein